MHSKTSVLERTVTAEDLVERAKAFAPSLKGVATEVEKLGRVPASAIDKLKELGLNRICQPEFFGGTALPPSVIFRVCFEIGRVCPSTAWSTMVANCIGWFASFWPAEVQEEIWGENPNAMVALSGVPAGSGRKVDGGYEVWGRWPWASNCDNSDWAIVSCAIAENDGDIPETQWFMAPIKELEIDQNSWNMAGTQGTGSKTLIRENPLFIPDIRRVTLSQSLSGTTPGHKWNKETPVRFDFSALNGVAMVGPILGMVQGALDTYIDLMKGKVRTKLKAGATATVASSSITQVRVADVSARIDAATALLLGTAQKLEAMALSGQEIGPDEKLRVRRDIGFAARQALRGMNILVEGAGASSFATSVPFQQFWRDLTVSTRHFSLDPDIIYEAYGRHLFGLPPEE